MHERTRLHAGSLHPEAARILDFWIRDFGSLGFWNVDLWNAAVAILALQCLLCCAPPMASIHNTMEWHCETCRDVFLQDWENQARSMDPAGYTGCRSVHEWMFQRMFIMCQNPPRHFGTIGWAWYNAIHSGQWIGGYAWCDGCSCASQTAPLALNDPGCRWWPCIVAIDSNDTIPFYCPALAWQRARPWTIHRSRVSIEPGSRTGLCPVRAIEDISATSAAHNEEAPRSAWRTRFTSVPHPQHPEPEGEPEIRE